jgi:Ca-activated chloride channel family protein
VRFTTYTKYKGAWADALNLESLLGHLSDFLLNGGFAGGPHYHPYWGWSGTEDTNSLDALKRALLKALMESGQLTPEMIRELRGEGEGDADVQQAIAELLDRLIERLTEEGYIKIEGGAPTIPGPTQDVTGQGDIDEAKQAAQQVQFDLTSKGTDFLGYSALKSLLSAIGKSNFGSHDTPHLATGVEAEAASRPYEFGDTMNLDIPATLKNALARAGEGKGVQFPLDIDYPDLMVHQAEYRSSCATVLMLDVSHSMVLYGEDRFTPAKRVALALAHLIRTQFPGDSLQVLTFGDRAEEIPLSQLSKAQVGPYHTNTAEGLEMARRMLTAQKKDMRQIIMITDGKPSAVTLPDGRIYKNSGGMDALILQRTFQEVAACRKAGVLINTFMLARDPYLVQFVQKVSEIARGKAYFTTTMTLGQYIMMDFMKRKRRRIA